MKLANLINNRPLALALLAAGMLALPPAARAEVTDLAHSPLAFSSQTTVLPNLMFLLDNSGSMQWSYLPDFVVQDVQTTNNWHRTVGYRTSLCNKIYYNPKIAYTLPVNADGTFFPAPGFTAAPYDGFVSSSPKINLSTGFMAWRSNSSNPANPNGFNPDCWTTNGQCTVDNSSSSVIKNQQEAAYYMVYTGSATFDQSMCADGPSRVDPLGSQSSQFRWKKTVVSSTSGPGGTDERQNFANWFSFYRTRINMMKSAAGLAFQNVNDAFRVGFIDLNAGSPPGANEFLAVAKFDQTQRTNWYNLFYTQSPSGGTPMRSALSRVGRYYAGKKDGPNAGMGTDPMQYSCQSNFVIVSTDGFWNGAAGYDVDQKAVGNQDNVLSTSDPKFVTRESGTFDGNLSPTTSAGTSAGGKDTLADVAMYYYKNELRAAVPVNDQGVRMFLPNDDPNNPQFPAATPGSQEPKGVTNRRMMTFTLGLGVPGKMTFDPNYPTATSGDFFKIRNGSTGCSWSAKPSDVCNWPLPQADSLTALDDLWHAAVNGRGRYFSASDPTQLVSGLTSALAGVSARVGAAAASATSSPNITQTNNFIFSTTYRTGFWDGEVVAQAIDTQTGNVSPTILWSAATNLNTMVGPTSDGRVIYTLDISGATPSLKPFQYGNLTAAEKAFFDNVCQAPQKLSQCVDLAANPGLLSQANKGTNLVPYLRGQNGNEGTLFRQRQFVLGDPVNAVPVFVGAPPWSFGEGIPGDTSTEYLAFAANNKDRQTVLYVAANDGMLHALNANTGTELWAYVPRQIMPKMFELADFNYSAKHDYFVDGSPAVMDVFMSGSWHTILVGGLRLGGRGWYALDITNPGSPAALWEFCSDSTLCARSDVDMGFSFGVPIIIQRASDSKWVVLVTSGYNNLNPGSGQGILYTLDVATGQVLNKASTGVGDTTVICTAPTLCGPSGLADLSAWSDNFSTIPIAKWVYGGDLWGNLWRFDLQVSPPAVQRIALFKDGVRGLPQSVTTRPELGEIAGNRVVFIGTGRYLGVSDLSDPSTLIPALPYAYQESFYAVKDTGSDWGNFRNSTGVVKRTIISLSPTSRTTDTSTVNWSTSSGWYVDFNLSTGERVNLDPILVLGTLVVTTNVPNQNACTIGGDSWTYFYDYLTGQYVSTSVNNEVGSKKIGSLTVGNVVVRLPGGSLKLIQTDITGAKSTSGVPIGAGGATGKRISWRELIR